MKTRVLAFVLLLCSLTGVQTSRAQVNVSINIGAQPVWGPVGYNYVEYYYLPDIEAYYYVPGHQFIYLQGPNWVFAPALPAKFGHYNIYRGYKVVVNQPKPYLHHNIYKVRYQKYKGMYGKQVIIKNHPNKSKAKYGGAYGKAKGKRKH